jgi:hypothetical protein
MRQRRAGAEEEHINGGNVGDVPKKEEKSIIDLLKLP